MLVGKCVVRTLVRVCVYVCVCKDLYILYFCQSFLNRPQKRCEHGRQRFVFLAHLSTHSLTSSRRSVRDNTSVCSRVCVPPWSSLLEADYSSHASDLCVVNDCLPNILASRKA